MILFGCILANTLLIASFYGLTYVFYKLLPPVNRAAFSLAGEDLPFVSVMVPARNEEGKVGRCLKSLLLQNYRNLEIIVIDDRSTDNTAQVIQSYVDSPLNDNQRIKFVHGKDAPEGWIGKCNALAHAVGYAEGDWFVFTDADTYHYPNSIADAVAYALNNKTDLLSFVPMQELGSFPERLIMPVLLGSFLLGDPFHSINDPLSKRAYAYGQYIVCRRSSYQAIGGHKSVRGEIVEDHALARVFKENSFRISTADGKSLYSVRMYTDLETLWQGWTKNLYSFIESHVINLLIAVLLINTVALAPFVQLISTAWLAMSGNDVNMFFALNSLPVLLFEFVVLFLWFRLVSQHHAGTDWRNFFLMPFGSLAVTILFCHAAYLVLSGSQISWKGRRYVVNTSKTAKPTMPYLVNQSAIDYQPLEGYLEQLPVAADSIEVSTIS